MKTPAPSPTGFPSHGDFPSRSRKGYRSGMAAAADSSRGLHPNRAFL